ncbi:MAG: NAD(P)/FAD-dependent oxidoreductase [Pseudomonadota bacterium]
MNIANKKHIAIVGSGTAGLAVAAFLKQQGHEIALFERFDAPKPIGAGLLLQPTGLACLARLGLDQQAIEFGATINRIYGEAANQRVIFDIGYGSLGEHLFGVGIHRGALFSILHQHAQDTGVTITTSCAIADTHLSDGKRFITNDNGQQFGPFDLVIDASGMRSALRRHGQVTMDRPYPFGAIWGVLDDPEQAFGKDLLQQRYDGAHVMIGMLAIGRSTVNDTKRCTFFWSLPPGGYERWLDDGLPAWKAQVIGYWPELAPFMDQIDSADALQHAQYSDIVMSRWNEDRLVFVGDAAHNTSPQLGQGANLALADALVLSQMIERHDDINTALRAYSDARRSPVHFYQRVSRWLTPFFQSHSRMAGVVRDASFGVLCKTPYVKTQMLRTLAGIKTGWFTHADPGRWHERYRIR